ncbi:MAG: hypothetical protein H0U13_00355, partial [Gemmatimonadaceae bacterium]|nr:hypothetical protein [Gemmatimonadaceae bacterium]
MFNVRVPVETAGGNDVFLMNTFTDAQLLVSRDVAALLDRIAIAPPDSVTTDERSALRTLT